MSASWSPRSTTRARSSPVSTTTRTRTLRRISSRAPTPARRGRRSPAICPPAAPSIAWPRTTSIHARLCPVRDVIVYVPSAQYGGAGKSFQGESFYTAENPPFGATFTYSLKDGLKTRKQKRQAAEKEAAKSGKTPPYPTPAEL